MLNYLISIVGAIFMMALRIYDSANITSAFLVIIGITCLLYGIRHISTKKEYILIAVLFSLIYVVRFYDYTDSHILDIILGIGIGLLMFVIMVFERLFKKYDKKFWYVFIYPVIYILFMYFTEVIKINLPFRLDTYLSCIQTLCQITSLLGIYVLDFLIALTASIIVFIIDNKNLKETKFIIAIYLITICLVLSYGLIHLNKTNKEESLKNDYARIACVSGPNNYAYDTSGTYPTIEESINILMETVESVTKENVDILLFSEEAFGIYDVDEEMFIEKAKSIAALNNINICLAYEIEDSNNDTDGKGFNKLCFISNNGEVLYEYTKYNIIPFIETADYIKGDKGIESFEINIDDKSLNIACCICYDMDYDLFTSTIESDTELLLVPTWDWNVIKEQHFDVAILRAIANKITLVRSTYDGYNAVIDSAGNILSKDSTINLNYKNIFIYDVPIK